MVSDFVEIVSNPFMQIIDISWPISDQMTTYKNKQDVLISATRTWESHQSRESRLSCGVHTGTHVDAPAHFLEHGQTIDQINLNQLIGACRVFDLTHVSDYISASDLQLLDFTNCQRVLFKTKNSLELATALFNPNFVYLDQSAATYLASQKVRVVGVDGLGIERNQPGHETHKTLFEHDILIIEGLRLGQVVAGTYELVCLPLALVGTDGAPARAILIASPKPAHKVT